ncbi:MAG: hypothetical protein AAF721_10305 [Myxococcota bacterium]
MNSTIYMTPNGERQHGHCSTAWTLLLARLEATPEEDLEATLDESDASASEMSPLERQNLGAWTRQYRGKPDPRFRVARCIECHGTKPSVFAKLMADPNIAEIEALEVRETPLGMKAVDALLASSIKRLSLLALEEIGLKPEAVAKLMTWPVLEQVRVLSLAYHSKFGTKSIMALAEAPWLASLELLDLSGCADKVSRKAIEALARVPFTRLRSFSTSGSDYITAKGRGLPFLRGPGLGQLDLLSLHNMGFGDAELEELAEAPVLGKLKTLHLGNNEFSSEGLAKFLGSVALESVEELVATHRAQRVFDRRVAEAVAEAPYLPQLRRLELGDGEGKAILAQCPRVPASLRPRLAA